MNQKLEDFGIFILMSSLLAVFLGLSADVLCISNDHVSIEKAHKKTSFASDMGEHVHRHSHGDEGEHEHSHHHYFPCSDSDESHNDCVDFELIQSQLAKDEREIVEMSYLTFLKVRDLSLSTFLPLTIGMVRKKNLSEDFRQCKSPPHALKKLIVLQV